MIFLSRVPASLREEVTRLYDAAGRHYHNNGHIRSVLFAVSFLREMPPEPLQLAAWLHDVIYDPRRADNEEASAAFAVERLSPLDYHADETAEVSRLILLTKSHEVPPDDDDGAALIDADLSILGAAAAEYDAYAVAIRREYEWVPEEAYRSGRVAVLRRFLERERIYRSPRVVEWEARARENLAREIAALTGS